MGKIVGLSPRALSLPLIAFYLSELTYALTHRGGAAQGVNELFHYSSLSNSANAYKRATIYRVVKTKKRLK